MEKPPDDLAPIDDVTRSCLGCGGVMRSHGRHSAGPRVNDALWYVCAGCGKTLRADH